MGPRLASGDDVRAWAARRSSRELLRREQQLIGQLAADRQPGRVLQLSMLEDWPLDCPTAVTRHQLRVDARGQVDGALVAAVDELPLESECVHLVVCHHVQELLGDYQGLLGETQRVLRPGGVLLLVGFGRSQKLPDFLARVPAGRLSRELERQGWGQLRCHPVLHREGLVGTRLLRGRGGWPAAIRWLAPLCPAFVLMARKRDSSAPVLRLRGLGGRAVNGAVSSSATGA